MPNEIIYPTPTIDEEKYCSTAFIRSMIRDNYVANKDKYNMGSGESIQVDKYGLYCDVNKTLVGLDYMIPAERILSNMDVIDDEIPIYNDWVHEDRPIRVYFNTEAIKIIYGSVPEMFVMLSQLNVPAETYKTGVHQYYYTIEPEYKGFLMSEGLKDNIDIQTKG